MLRQGGLGWGCEGQGPTCNQVIETNSVITALGFRKVDFRLFRDLLGRNVWDASLESKNVLRIAHWSSTITSAGWCHCACSASSSKGHGNWGIFLILKKFSQADLQERQEGKSRELKASQPPLDAQESCRTNPPACHIQPCGHKKAIWNSQHGLANKK